MCEWRSELNPDYHCRVSPEPGSDYCIFHEPGEKDIGRFKQKFYEQLDGDGPEEARNPRYDFRGYFFPTGIVASGGSREAGQLILSKEIAGDLIGSEATIKGGADFSRATIGGYANFRHATVKGGANFWYAAIEGADFSYASIVVLFWATRPKCIPKKPSTARPKAASSTAVASKRVIVPPASGSERRVRASATPAREILSTEAIEV